MLRSGTGAAAGRFEKAATGFGRGERRRGGGELLLKLLPPKRAESARVQGFLEARAIEKTAEFRAQWTKEFDAPGREEWWTLYLARSARARG